MKKKQAKTIEKTEKEVEAIEEKIDEARTNRAFIYSIIGITALILLVLAVPHLVPDKRPKTLDEAFDETIGGEVTETQFTYNGYAFVYAEGLWYTQVQSGNQLYTVPFHFSPKEVEDVPFDGYMAGFMAILMNKKIENASPAVYITFDPTSLEQKYIALANGELAITLAKTLNVKPFPACTKDETDGCVGVPTVTCNSTDAPVIFLDHQGGAGIELRRNCMILKGYGMNLTRSVDRYLYDLFGVI